MALKKHHIEVAVIAVGLVALAVILPINIRRAMMAARLPGGADGARPESAPAQDASVSSETAAPAFTPEVKAKQDAALNKPLGKDPFSLSSAVTVTSVAKTSTLVLKGISTKKGSEPVALIGSCIARKGDTIGDAKIVEIGKDYVLLRSGGKEYTLTLERGM